jgi:hypothetical protein
MIIKLDNVNFMNSGDFVGAKKCQALKCNIAAGEGINLITIAELDLFAF